MPELWTEISKSGTIYLILYVAVKDRMAIENGEWIIATDHGFQRNGFLMGCKSILDAE